MANIYHFYEANRNMNNNNTQRSIKERSREREKLNTKTTYSFFTPRADEFELIKYSEGNIKHLNPFEGKEISDEEQLEIRHYKNNELVSMTHKKLNEIIIEELQFNVKYPIAKLVFAPFVFNPYI